MTKESIPSIEEKIQELFKKLKHALFNDPSNRMSTPEETLGKVFRGILGEIPEGEEKKKLFKKLLLVTHPDKINDISNIHKEYVPLIRWCVHYILKGDAQHFSVEEARKATAEFFRIVKEPYAQSVVGESGFNGFGSDVPFHGKPTREKKIKFSGTPDVDRVYFYESNQVNNALHTNFVFFSLFNFFKGKLLINRLVANLMTVGNTCNLFMGLYPGSPDLHFTNNISKCGSMEKAILQKWKSSNSWLNVSLSHIEQNFLDARLDFLMLFLEIMRNNAGAYIFAALSLIIAFSINWIPLQGFSYVETVSLIPWLQFGVGYLMSLFFIPEFAFIMSDVAASFLKEQVAESTLKNDPQLIVYARRLLCEDAGFFYSLKEYLEKKQFMRFPFLGTMEDRNEAILESLQDQEILDFLRHSDSYFLKIIKRYFPNETLAARERMFACLEEDSEIKYQFFLKFWYLLKMTFGRPVWSQESSVFKKVKGVFQHFFLDMLALMTVGIGTVGNIAMIAHQFVTGLLKTALVVGLYTPFVLPRHCISLVRRLFPARNTQNTRSETFDNTFQYTDFAFNNTARFYNPFYERPQPQRTYSFGAQPQPFGTYSAFYSYNPFYAYSQPQPFRPYPAF